MIYSSWRPDKGGYDYFKTAERHGYGDDLPVPKLRPRSPIGVASTSIGRTTKSKLVPAGSGEIAHGCILPLSRSRLKGLSGGDAAPTMLTKAVAVAAVVGVLYIVYRASEDSLSLKKLF